MFSHKLFPLGWNIPTTFSCTRCSPHQRTHTSAIPSSAGTTSALQNDPLPGASFLQLLRLASLRNPQRPGSTAVRNHRTRRVLHEPGSCGGHRSARNPSVALPAETPLGRVLFCAVQKHCRYRCRWGTVRNRQASAVLAGDLPRARSGRKWDYENRESAKKWFTRCADFSDFCPQWGGDWENCEGRIEILQLQARLSGWTAFGCEGDATGSY